MINYLYILILIALLIILYIIIFGNYIRGNLNQYKTCSVLFSNNKYNIPFYHECGERLNIFKNINSNDKVLEIGGNKGASSLIILKKLKNPKNLIVLEPSNNAYKILKQKANKYGFRAFNGCISKIPLYNQYTYNDDYIKVTKNKNNNLINTITYNQLQDKFNIVFDTLVIDAEGAYKSLFLDFPEIFNNIKKILIEWDGEYMHNFIINKGFREIDYYYHPILPNGINTYFKTL